MIEGANFHNMHWISSAIFILDMKGIYIPLDFFKLELTSTEMIILAIYKYYTEEGKLKCSVYTNESIAEMINVNVKTVIRAKQRFKKLGYIRTDGGIRTYYLGITKGQNVPGGGDKMSLGLGTKSPEGMDKMYPADGDNLYPHNKEEKKEKRKNKEEIKSELKEKQTVFDRVISWMDQETKEHIDYIRERYKEEIDRINQVEELVEEDEITESYLQGQARMFKNMLYQNNKIRYKAVLPKEKIEVSEVDIF